MYIYRMKKICIVAVLLFLLLFVVSSSLHIHTEQSSGDGGCLICILRETEGFLHLCYIASFVFISIDEVVTFQNTCEIRRRTIDFPLLC